MHDVAFGPKSTNTAKRHEPQIRGVREAALNSASTAIFRKASCACGGGCPACQAKSNLNISQPNDPAEIEADRMAERVMRMPVGVSKPVASVSNSATAIHRRCNACENEEDEKIQHKPLPANTSVSSQGLSHVNTVIGSGGSPLDLQTRSFFEPRMGYDLSSVRIHTDSVAGQSARAIDAKAYTLGNNIVFGNGEYKPESESGKHLLAHELAHVGQDTGKIHRKPVEDPVHDDLLEQFCKETGTPRESATRHSEQFAAWLSKKGLKNCRDVTVNPFGAQEPCVKDPEEPVPNDYAPPGGNFKPWAGQTGSDAKDAKGNSTFKQEGDIISERVLRTGDPLFKRTMPSLMEFDKQNCTLTSTVEVEFKKSSIPEQIVTDEELKTEKDRFFRVVKEKLNGWVEIEVGSSEKCTVCSGRTIPINIAAKEGTGEFASSIEVVKSIDREDAGHISVGVSDNTLWHEAGHVVLGAADEYQEKDPKKRKTPRPADKVTPGDFSIMDNSYLANAVMHTRHFSHLPAWLGRKFRDCNFELKEKGVFTGVDIRTPLSFVLPTTGYANFGGTHGMFINYGIDLGIPLTRARDWELFVGMHGSFLTGLSVDAQNAFLLGARIGIEKMWTPGAGGFNMGGFVEGGAAFFSDRSEEGGELSYVPGGYGYTGVDFGYKFSPSILNMSFNAELGAGLTSPMELHDIETFVKDEKMLPFFTAGLRATWMF